MTTFVDGSTVIDADWLNSVQTFMDEGGGGSISAPTNTTTDFDGSELVVYQKEVDSDTLYNTDVDYLTKYDLNTFEQQWKTNENDMTVAEKLGAMVTSVTDIGADSTGNADDYLIFSTANFDTLYVPPGTYLIGTSCTITANLIFEKGAVLHLEDDIILTFDGGTITAGRSQLFENTNDNVFFNTSNSVLYPEWWGAVADGSTNDSDALNQCVFAAGYGNNNCSVCLRSGGFIYTESTGAYTLGEGCYYITEAIDIKYGNVRIYSESDKATIAYALTDSSCFDISAVSTNTVSDVVIENINMISITYAGNSGIFAYQTDHVVVRDCRVFHSQYAYWFKQCAGTLLERADYIPSAYTDASVTSYHLILKGVAAETDSSFYGFQNTVINDCTLYNDRDINTTEVWGAYIYGSDLSGITLNGYTTVQAMRSIGIKGTAVSSGYYEYCHSMQINNVRFYDVLDSGIYVLTLGVKASININGGFIQLSSIFGTAPSAITINNSSGVGVNGVIIDGSKATGSVGFYNTIAYNCTYTGNKLINCYNPAFLINTKNCTFTGNIITRLDTIEALNAGLGASATAFYCGTALYNSFVGNVISTVVANSSNTAYTFATPITLDSDSSYNNFAFNAVQPAAVASTSSNSGTNNSFAGAYY